MPEGDMTKREALQVLMDLLLELYPDQSRAARIADMAGIDITQVGGRDVPVVYWWNLLVAAHRSRKIEALVKRASWEFSARTDDLKTAYTTYSDAPEATSHGVLFIGEDAINWEEVDLTFTHHLEQTRVALINHMKLFAGAGQDQDPLRRYVALRLRERRTGTEEDDTELIRIGTWTELVHLPQWVLVTGDPGSGKTTLLLHEAARLAEAAHRRSEAPVPVYLSLRTLAPRGTDSLLALAAEATGQSLKVTTALWREATRPLCLLLDRADELPTEALHGLVAALEGLHRLDTAQVHSVVVACRQGPATDLVRRSSIPFRRLLLEPLSSAEIDNFLERYGVPELKEQLGARQREVVQSPDLCSALAQSMAGRAQGPAPRNAGEIYELLVDRHLFGQDSGRYDYWRVKRPLLAEMGYRSLLQDRTYLVCDDAFETWIARTLAAIDESYARRRQVMPAAWTAADLVEELTTSPVVQKEQAIDGRELIAFTKSGFRDYLAAAHLASQDVESAQIRRELENLDPERSFETLVSLLGLQPTATGLFDVLYTAYPGLAADLWLENRPHGIDAPAVIVRRFEAETGGRETRGAGARPGQRPEPVTADLVGRTLRSRSPRQRLAAVSAASQWGLGGIDLLLQAAEDREPLIRAAACYALLHLGEPTWHSGREGPWPPLLSAGTGCDLHFHSLGGTQGWIGPLRILDTVLPSEMEIDLTVNRLDFQPFEVESWFNFQPTEPEQFAAYCFEAARAVDWVALLSRYWHVATAAARVARSTAVRSSLADLTGVLARKAQRFDAMGARPASDLGVTWGRIELPSPPATEIMDDQPYLGLRALYNRGSRVRALELGISSTQAMSGLGLSDELLAKGQERHGDGIEVVVGINELVLGAAPAASAGGETKGQVSSLTVAVPFKSLSGDLTLSLLRIGELVGASYDLPPSFAFAGALVVDKAQGVEIRCLDIAECSGGLTGMRVKLSLTIDSLAECMVRGVHVEELALDDGVPART